MEIPVGIKRTVVLCVLQSTSGMLLICRKEEPLIGKYVPVGGHLEPFETPREAVMREVKEETGLEIKNATLRGILTETSPIDYNWTVYVYSSETEPIIPPECKEGTLEWVPNENIQKVPVPLTDIFVYDYIQRSEFFVMDALYNKDLELVRLTDELTGKVLHKK